MAEDKFLSSSFKLSHFPSSCGIEAGQTENDVIMAEDYIYIYLIMYAEFEIIQGVLLPDRQTLRDDSRHEDKHY